MKYSIFLFFCIACFAIPSFGEDDDDRFLYRNLAFRKVEVSKYAFQKLTPQIKLEMAYADDEIKNPEKWFEKRDRVVPYEVDLVFTLYPKNIEDWRTNYFDLLNGRMKALFAIDSSLEKVPIKWNMVLQTDPHDEETAKEYFHGFVIKYRPKKVKYVTDVRTPQELKALISGIATTRDSTVLKVMERHPEWDDMLVVMDWTGSMYKYGAQLVLWHKLNMVANHSSVKHFVFFNDGNKKRSWQKTVGKTGGVYRARTDEIEELVETMMYVMKKGNGGDAEENDLEALLTGTQFLEDYKEVILIADNKSAVRDIELLSKVKQPVRVIICDQKGQKIHPDYVKIAKETGGSIHTYRKDYQAKKKAVKELSTEKE
ncbi:MAG: hypothetical protein MRZ79_03555 [Bacteroidia bacterium]|nr:hypothetical protein [Bacteroidia bacterium]